MSSMKHDRCKYFFNNSSLIKGELDRHKLFLFLDYDGTLTPIVESPEKAILSEETRSLIMRLKKRFPVAIISGRTLRDIRERVGIKELIYAGNHGAEIWDGKKTFVSPGFSADTDQLKDFLNRLNKALFHIQGILIEDKGITASIHYRKIRIKYLEEFLNIFRSIANGYREAFGITNGKKVFEIRPLNMWNKGDAVGWIWKNLGKDRFPVYIGDDTTDEDAFRVLKGSGITVSIGCSSVAGYYLKNQKDVKELLLFLLS
ncbi:MAG: trehalose-phosphatase [Spirochaetes bacterium]|nr:trehalose-phosphatase [Spirochaetota bacterium]